VDQGARQQGIRFTNSNYKKWLRRGPGSLRVQVPECGEAGLAWTDLAGSSRLCRCTRRGQASEGLKPFGEVKGHQEGLDVRFELAMSAVMVPLNGSLLEGSVHPFNLAVGPRMTWLG
jgi:hypothetical protein